MEVRKGDGSDFPDAPLCGKLAAMRRTWLLPAVLVPLTLSAAPAAAAPTARPEPVARPEAAGKVEPAPAATAAGQQAPTARQILACASVDFACPALLQAAAARTEPCKQLAQMLGDPAIPNADKAKAALALSLLDARDQLDALHAAASGLQGQPEQADLLAAQARMGDVRAAGGLMALVGKTTDQRARLLAVGGLGLLHHKPAAAVLAELLKRDDEPRVQAEAARALGLLGESGVAAPLLAMAARPRVYPPSRVHALGALASLKVSAAVPLAVMLVDTADRDVGRAALQVLTAMPAPWVEPIVLFALEVPGLRGQAARAAVAIDCKACGARVASAVHNGDHEPGERAFALQALGQLKPQGAAAAVLARVAKAGADEQVQLLHALPIIEDKTVVPTLVELLASTKPELVSHVVFALENLTGQHLGPDVAAWRKYAGTADAKPKE
jgi:HEAT repeat protein